MEELETEGEKEMRLRDKEVAKVLVGNAIKMEREGNFEKKFS